MEIKINYLELNKLKSLFFEIQKQIVNDYIAEKGSHLPKEDSQTAAIVCMLTNSYEIK